MPPEPFYSLFRCIADVPLTLVSSRTGLTEIHLGAEGGVLPCSEYPNFLDDAFSQLEQYLSGKRNVFQLSVDLQVGSPFQREVWAACRKIPYGQTCTYGEMASRIGFPGAARAVGAALSKNPLPIVVPCHRVIGKNGKLTGFSCGLEWKERLLRLEGALPEKR